MGGRDLGGKACVGDDFEACKFSPSQIEAGLGVNFWPNGGIWLG